MSEARDLWAPGTAADSVPRSVVSWNIPGHQPRRKRLALSVAAALALAFLAGAWVFSLAYRENTRDAGLPLKSGTESGADRGHERKAGS